MNVKEINAIKEQRALKRHDIICNIERELIMFDAETKRILEGMGIPKRLVKTYIEKSD